MKHERDDEPIRTAFEGTPYGDELSDPSVVEDVPALVEPVAPTILTESRPAQEGVDPRDAGALLLVIALVAGLLVVVLGVAGDGPIVVGARILLAFVGAGMHVGRFLTLPRDEVEASPYPTLAAPILGGFVAIWATFGADSALASEAASLAGIIVTATAITTWAAQRASSPIVIERAWINDSLTVPARRLDENGLPSVTDELRVGDRIMVESGEAVPADGVVTGDDVVVLPWLGALTTVRKRTGDAIVAGARVVSGRLIAQCVAVGVDRAWVRLLVDARRRVDTSSPTARATRAMTTRWAPVATIVGAVAGAVSGRSMVEVAMVTVAIYAALTSPVLGSIAATHAVRSVLVALRRGIAYRSADAWDRAGRVGAVVFCARGTLLLGEPELTELEVLGDRYDAEELLGLAAAAERGQTHPVAIAILRAARTRGIRLDGVRNTQVFEGLGVKAVTSGGQELYVGKRALLMDHHISVAAAEHRVAELEALGRTVVLVAVGGRLAGILTLQDGLRPGARAAVQHVTDAEMDPVILSGDARETCEAIGRALDVEHLRPDVAPGERGAEVRKLMESGVTVAAIGHVGADDAALAAADVAIALGAAGSAADVDIALASEDVRDASLSLALARARERQTQAAVALVLGPALLGALVSAFGVLPAAYAPLASLFGSAAALLHARSLEAPQEPQHNDAAA